MNGKFVPMRMCIVCKSKLPQSNLCRFQVINTEICAFSKVGRSFYVCRACINGDEKKAKKALGKVCKNKKQNTIAKIKEIIANG